MAYLSVYAVSRHWGGPEEGGWWYNWADYTGDSVEVDDGEDQNAKRAALLAKYADDQPRYNIYSCANDGPQYEVYLEDEKGECQSLERPHYS